MLNAEASIVSITGGDVCKCESKRYAAKNMREFLGEYFLGNCLKCNLLHTPTDYTWSKMVMDAENRMITNALRPVNGSEETPNGLRINNEHKKQTV